MDVNLLCQELGIDLVAEGSQDVAESLKCHSRGQRFHVYLLAFLQKSFADIIHFSRMRNGCPTIPFYKRL